MTARASFRLATLAVAALGCGGARDRSAAPISPPTPAPTPVKAAAPVTWVGGKSCAECHQREWQAWSGSHHDRAMQPATADTVLGVFANAKFRYAGVTSTFFRRDGKFWVRTDGPDGALHDYEVGFTFGVTPLQQYLVPFPDGRMQALSIAWDARPKAAGGQRWFHLYPGEKVRHDDVLHWTRLSQNWNYMCAECHSTNLQKGYDPAKNSYDTTWTDIDVSCEACHGPGSRHVAWARDRREGAPPGDSGLVVRLEKAAPAAFAMAEGGVTAHRTAPLSSAGELDTCARCHARRASFGDDPGRPFLDVGRPSLLERDLYHADGQILGEVYEWGSFTQSKMYREGVRCSDCHEPHSLRLRQEGNAMCGTCHLPAAFDAREHHHHEPGTPGSRCVDCHMPVRTYMVVDPRRDHSFRVPRPDLSARIGTPNACTACHTGRSEKWAAKALEGWFGTKRRAEAHWGEAIHAGRLGLPGAAARLSELVGDVSTPAIARATALDLLAVIDPGAVPRAALDDREPLVRFAAVLALEGLPVEEGLASLVPRLDDPSRLVRMQAARLLAAAPRDRLSGVVAARLDRSLGEYVAGERFNADHPAGRLNLAILLAQSGQGEAAEQECRAALALEPAFPGAYVNLADLYRATGREVDAERTLRDGLARVPEDAALHHALGLLLVRGGNTKEALVHLARASLLAPDNPRFAYVHGVALHSVGDAKGAIAALARALARHPTDAELLFALATMSRDRGAREEALGYARRLVEVRPGDAGARGLAAELEGSAGR